MKSNLKIHTAAFICTFLINNVSLAIQLNDTVPQTAIYINEDVINAFKTIWNEEHAPLVYDEYIKSDTIVEGGEAEILKATIMDYFYSTDTTNDTLGFMDLLQENIIEYQEGPKKEEELIVLSEEEQNEITVIDENYIQEQTLDTVREEAEKNLFKNIFKKVKPKEKQKSFVPENDKELVDLIFNVQIAASRKLLDLKTINQIYNGNYPVFISYEDGWYKYRIGKTTSINEANKLKIFCNVKGAFIVAYKDNKKLNTIEYKKIMKDPIILQNKNYKFYKLQIAASKNPLSEEILKKIYTGNKPINLIIENDWYKYQIGTFNNIDSARIEKINCNVKYAFLVKYINGQKDHAKTKIHVPEIKKQPLITKKDTIIFKIQIAAEKRAISNYTLINNYKNFKKIKILYEEGLFKYYVGEYDDYFDALKIKNQLNNKDAFVVAFKNNKKIRLNEAINFKNE